MRIPENKIEEIRASANIVDIVSEYVQLRKRGSNYIGLCPFHNEKTPSFTVSEDKQIFHCFGCHAGGNVFSFLMQYEKISFVESVQELAESLGITIDVEENTDYEKQSEQEILYDVNTSAARYFSDNLLNRDEGEIAREYFKNRNIKPQTMRAFGLGYSLPGWEHFLKFSKENNIDLEKALALGLVGQSSDGRLYDKFSGRIIFPIFSPNGRVVAFAGRILQNRSGVAKYLNSPESQIYVKGRILYGLSHAKDEIRRVEKAILVEGYMDLISLYQNGIKNVVAVSGTALTEEQVQLLSRYTKNVVLLFDADTAGIKASMRSIELLLRRDLEIKIASFPEGEDPDSYVNKFGKESFEDLIKRAQNFVEYETAYYEAQGMFSEPSKMAEAIRELVKPIALINDELKRSLLIKSIAQKFNLREKLLETELSNVNQKPTSPTASEVRNRLEKFDKKEGITENAKRKASPAAYQLECELIKLLFEGSESIIKLVLSHIAPEDFEIEVHQKLANLVMDAYQNNEELIAAYLINKIDDDEIKNYVLEITFDNKHSISKNWENLYPGVPQDQRLNKIANDTIKKYRLEKLDGEIKVNHKKIQDAANEDERFEIMKIIRELNSERQNILQEL